MNLSPAERRSATSTACVRASNGSVVSART